MMRLHVISGHLTLILDAGGEDAHDEVEVQFAKPVDRVVVTLSGFEVIPSDGAIATVGSLGLSVGVTQQQIPSKTAQIHGHLRLPGGQGCRGEIFFVAMGIE